jgi:3-phenylpropionate/trans-cinnamate dioxygenase ferredoxin reductase subunit
MDGTPVSVTATQDVGPNAIALELETPADFDAMPGQFVKLSAEIDGEEESRFYTISSPDVEETFETTIEIDPEGTLGPWFADLEAGDSVHAAGPYGNAYYEGEAEGLILAGGPGVGPAIGIAARAIDDGNTAAIVYRDDDPIHQERLDALEADGVSVSVLGDGEDMQDAISATLTEDTQVFVYGFADFLDDATDNLEQAGGKPDDAKMENFG